jgi:hypothetical protein
MSGADLFSCISLLSGRYQTANFFGQLVPVLDQYLTLRQPGMRVA